MFGGGFLVGCGINIKSNIIPLIRGSVMRKRQEERKMKRNPESEQEYGIFKILSSDSKKEFHNARILYRYTGTFQTCNQSPKVSCV